MEPVITIELFGTPYRFKADADPDKANKVADYLREQVQAVEKQQKSKSPEMDRLMVMIIAALNIASENIDLKQKAGEQSQQINQRLKGLLASIEHRQL